MAEWTIEDVAARFHEAAQTGRRLPRVRVQGYVSSWPRFVQENASADDRLPRVPPTPEALDRMLETMRWVLWLEERTRHLVWLRAQEHEWQHICRRLGCDRTTAWRRWKRAMALVARRLNSGEAVPTTVPGAGARITA